MSIRRVSASVVLVGMAVLSTLWTLAAPTVAHYDAEGPCIAFLNPTCLFVVVLPELDHDVDLTTNDGVWDSSSSGVVPPPAQSGQ